MTHTTGWENGLSEEYQSGPFPLQSTASRPPSHCLQVPPKCSRGQDPSVANKKLAFTKGLKRAPGSVPLQAAEEVHSHSQEDFKSHWRTGGPAKPFGGVSADQHEDQSQDLPSQARREFPIWATKIARQEWW